MRIVLVFLLVAGCSSTERQSELERHIGEKLDALVAKRGQHLSTTQREAFLVLCGLDRDYYPTRLSGSAAAVPTHIDGKPIPDWFRQRMSQIPNSELAVEMAETQLDVLRTVAEDEREVDRLQTLYSAFRARECGNFPPRPER